MSVSIIGLLSIGSIPSIYACAFFQQQKKGGKVQKKSLEPLYDLHKAI